MIKTELSEESKRKIFLIEDINKIYLLYLERVLSVREFDALYDLPIHKLERALVNTQDHFEREKAYHKMWH